MISGRVWGDHPFCQSSLTSWRSNPTHLRSVYRWPFVSPRISCVSSSALQPLDSKVGSTPLPPCYRNARFSPHFGSYTLTRVVATSSDRRGRFHGSMTFFVSAIRLPVLFSPHSAVLSTGFRAHFSSYSYTCFPRLCYLCNTGGSPTPETACVSSRHL